MLCTKPLYLTYEELKPASWPSCCTLRACCTLPMRNWNILFIFYSYQYEFRCTLPMRNWNPLATFSNNSFNILLYLTYEELKLLDSASSTMFSVTCCTLPMRNWNTIIFFIINFFSRYIFIFCCTLPMRNWNFFIVNSLL